MNTAEHISDCLTVLRLKHHALEDGMIVVPFSRQHAQYELFVTVHGPVITLVARPNLVVPEDRAAEVLELANAINADYLRAGSLWVSPDDRFLAWEYGLLAFEPVAPELLGLAVAAADVVDRLYPAFARVIWAGQTAQQALAVLKADEGPEPSCGNDGDSDLELAV